MICPNCKKDNPDDSTFCIYCGRKMPEYTAPEQAEAKTGKRKTVITVILSVTAVTVVFAIVFALLIHFDVIKLSTDKKSDLKEKTTENAKSENNEENSNQVILKIGNKSVSAAKYNYYYIVNYYEVKNQADQYDNYYGAGYGKTYVGFDSSKTPKNQTYNGVLEGYTNPTWEDYFDYTARHQIQMNEAFADLAKKEGITLSEEQKQEIEQVISTLKSYAQQAGYSSDKYISARYGNGVNEKLIREIIEEQYLAQNYREKHNEAIENAIIDDEIVAYYNSNIEHSVDDRIKPVDVRHILIKFDADTVDGKQKEEYLKKAQDILGEYNSNPTEDNFAALAQQYSEDGGSSSNGGLYEKVNKGDMVEEFDNWIFDESRKPGDTGIVLTQYGYHVMYYVGNNNPEIWYSRSKSELAKEKEDQYYGSIIAMPEYEINPKENMIDDAKEQIDIFIGNFLIIDS